MSSPEGPAVDSDRQATAVIVFAVVLVGTVAVAPAFAHSENETDHGVDERTFVAYMEWAEARGVSIESKNLFARRLGDHIDFERTSEYRNGETVRCYEGIALTEENQQ
jgi:hypothetical protein